MPEIKFSEKLNWDDKSIRITLAMSTNQIRIKCGPNCVHEKEAIKNWVTFLFNEFKKGGITTTGRANLDAKSFKACFQSGNSKHRKVLATVGLPNFIIDNTLAG